jgi:hypothetical protein
VVFPPLLAMVCALSTGLVTSNITTMPWPLHRPPLLHNRADSTSCDLSTLCRAELKALSEISGTTFGTNRRDELFDVPGGPIASASVISWRRIGSPASPVIGDVILGQTVLS